jgi:hypothetical protein
MSLFLIKYNSITELCQLLSINSNCNYNVNQENLFKKTPKKSLDADDYIKIRNVVSWLLKNQNTIDTNQFLEILLINNFDQRVFNAKRNSIQKIEPLELDETQVKNLYEKMLNLFEKPDTCNFLNLNQQIPCKIEFNFKETFGYLQIQYKSEISNIFSANIWNKSKYFMTSIYVNEDFKNFYIIPIHPANLNTLNLGDKTYMTFLLVEKMGSSDNSELHIRAILLNPLIITEKNPNKTIKVCRINPSIVSELNQDSILLFNSKLPLKQKPDFIKAFSELLLDCIYIDN